LKSNQPTLTDSTSVISSRASDSGVSPCNGPGSETHPESGRDLVPASRGAAPAPEKGTPTSATYGPLFGTSYSQADLPLFSASRSPAPQLSERLGEALKNRLSRFGSMEYGQTWKKRVTPSGLRYWAHTVSGRPTSGNGVTGSRTPTAGDGEGGVKEIRPGCAGRYKLRDQAALAGHPTPDAHPDCPNTGTRRENGRIAKRLTQQGLGPVSQLAGHPTCSARDWKDTPGMAQTGINPDGTQRSRLDMLPRVSALAGHATPRVTTNSGIGNPERACDGKSRLEDQCHGANTESTDTSTAKTAAYRLNPGFSLWLMIGIPGIVDAWASCGVRAMEFCRRSRRSS